MLELTATDAAGLTTTVTRRIDPRTVDLTFETSPPGLALSIGSYTGTAPFTRTVLRGSSQGVIADASQTLSGTTYAFTGWSDGGAATHQITAPATATTYRATYTAQAGGPAGLVGAWGFDEANGARVRRVRARQRRDDRGRHADGERALRRRPDVRRRQRHGDRARRRLARPDDRDDPRGVGQPDRARDGVADRDAQGARLRPRLRAVRARRRRPQRRLRVHRGRARRREPGGAAAQRVDARRDDL